MKKTVTYLDKSAKFEIRNETEHIQRHWMAGNFYETQRNGVLNYCYLNQECMKGKTVIDVGAALGNHTLFFLKVCGAKHVIAIEPRDINADHLRANIKTNRMTKRVTVIEGAAGAKGGKGRLVMPKTPASEGGQLMGQLKLDKKGKIDVVAIDDLDPENVGLIKIDIEGGEIEALKGMMKTIAKCKPTIIIETEGRGRSHYTKALEMLTPHGYQPVSHKGQPIKWNHASTYIFEAK
jgi:FkbM family methyltransferase